MFVDDLFSESKFLSKNIQNIINYRYIYDNEIIFFDSPKIQIFHEYYDFLKVNSKIETLDIKYHYKPEYLSYDKYKTKMFFELIMFINDCMCVEDFNMSKVYLPSYDSIFYVLRNYIKFSDRVKKISYFGENL